MTLTLPAVRSIQPFLAHARDVDLHTYSVFAERAVPLRFGRIRLHVIGESSLVLVEAGGMEWAEAILCAGDEARPASIACARIGVAHPGCAALAAHNPGLTYEARLWTTRLDEEPFSHSLEHVLEYRFPGPDHPVTRIEAGPDPDGLLLRTRHDYPEYAFSVWSESVWRF